MISRFLLASILALAPYASAAEPGLPPGTLRITFETDSAVASGVTPGGTVVWIGASRSREEWSDHFFHWRQTTEDTDKDRVVTFPRKGGFPQMTILVAVDISSGSYGVGATYPLESDVPAPDLGGAKTDPNGLLTSFAQKGPTVDILVARAGSGVWAARVLDGGPLDDDGLADGTVTIGFAALPSRAGRAERLDGIRPGDVVALVDASGPSVRVARIAVEGGKE